MLIIESLNDLTKKDVYPLPRIDDAFDTLQDANYFSSIDWRVAFGDKGREMTAFITRSDLYRFGVRCFG